MRTFPGRPVSRDVPVRVVATVLLVIALTACGGGTGGDVPDGWTATSDDVLRFAVPADAVASDPPVDQNARTEHVLGDDPAAPYIASYRSSVTTDAGDRADAGTYAAQLFGVQGHLGGREGFETTELVEQDVPGAVEAGRMQVRYEEPAVGDTVVQDVLLVVTEEHIYDLRFARIGDDAVGEADIDALFASVSVDG
jgi:hypothetical protein